MEIYALRMTGPLAVLDTLRGIQAKYGNKYCWPSQEKLLERLRECHFIKISRRTLNYWLKDLEARKLIKRFKRYTRNHKAMSTAYYICNRAQKNAGKIRKVIGYAKRLRALFPALPNHVQNPTHYMITETSGYEKKPIGGGPAKEPPTDFTKSSSILESLGLRVPSFMKKPS